MEIQYKMILLIGAISRIGRALHQRRFICGSSWRRKERLEELAHRYGHEKVSAVPFDITKIDTIRAFVRNVTGTHEDLDCFVLNRAYRGKVTSLSSKRLTWMLSMKNS